MSFFVRSRAIALENHKRKGPYEGHTRRSESQKNVYGSTRNTRNAYSEIDAR